MLTRNRIFVSLITLIASLLLGAAISHTAPPSLISIQGKLTEVATGDPVPPGVKSFVFRIYDASVAGTQVWPAAGGEAQNISTDDAGLWNTSLGVVNPLTDAVFADSVRWLEITVNGEVQSPRIRLVTGPYAMRVATIDGATSGQVTGMITVTGSNEGMRVRGTGTGVSNMSFVSFRDASAVAKGFVGDGASSDDDMYVGSYAGNVHLYTSTGAELRVNSDGDVVFGPAGNITYRATSGAEDLRIIRGVLNADGSIIVGTGFTVSHTPGSGTYTINFSSPFAGSPSVTCAAELSPGQALFAATDGVIASSAVIKLINPANLAAPEDGPFHFIAVGPR